MKHGMRRFVPLILLYTIVSLSWIQCDLLVQLLGIEHQRYNLTVRSSPGGTTIPSGTATVLHGETISIYAVAYADYRFVRWEVVVGNSVNVFSPGDASTEVILTGGDAEIRALFELLISIVTLSASEGGSVSPSEAKEVPAGQEMEISASPLPGYQFDKWTLLEGNASFQNSLSATTTMIPGIGTVKIRADFSPM